MQRGLRFRREPPVEERLDGQRRGIVEQLRQVGACQRTRPQHRLPRQFQQRLQSGDRARHHAIDFSVSHANLAEFINPCSAEVRHGVAAMGGELQRHAAGVNGVITQQGMQISFNQIFDGLAVACFLLVAVVWLAKPPFWHKDNARMGKSAGH